MKTLNTKLIVGMLATLAAFASGCEIQTNPNPTPTGTPSDCYGDFSVANQTGETVDVELDGAYDSDDFAVTSGSTVTTSLLEGSYSFVAIGRNSGYVYRDGTAYVSCGGNGGDTLLAVASAAYFELTNATIYDAWVTIDGYDMPEILYAGSTATYELSPGYHEILVEDVDTGDTLYYENGVTYFAADVITPMTLTMPAELPLVEVSVSADYQFNYGCVQATVDGFGTDFANDTTGTTTSDVCGDEFGYFSMYDGFHTVDFYDDLGIIESTGYVEWFLDGFYPYAFL